MQRRSRIAPSENGSTPIWRICPPKIRRRSSAERRRSCSSSNRRPDFFGWHGWCTQLPGTTAWYSKPWLVQEYESTFDCHAYHGLEYQAVAPRQAALNELFRVQDDVDIGI